MEKVFWLMWLADVVGSISVIGFVALIALGLGFGGIFIVAGLDDGGKPFGRAWKVGRWLLIPMVLGALTPNTNTIRVLAVASAADAAANTQLGAKGLEALNAVLDRVIAETSKKK